MTVQAVPVKLDAKYQGMYEDIKTKCVNVVDSVSTFAILCHALRARWQVYMDWKLKASVPILRYGVI